MPVLMTDEEFLDYCDAHSETPRAGFVPDNIVRLLELAGEEKLLINTWKQVRGGIYSFHSDQIYPMTKKARARL